MERVRGKSDPIGEQSCRASLQQDAKASRAELATKKGQPLLEPFKTLDGR